MSTESDKQLTTTIDQLRDTVADLKAAAIRQGLDDLKLEVKTHGDELRSQSAMIAAQTGSIGALGDRVGALEKAETTRAAREEIERERAAAPGPDPMAQSLSLAWSDPRVKGGTVGGLLILIIVTLLQWLTTGNPLLVPPSHQEPQPVHQHRDSPSTSQTVPP